MAAYPFGPADQIVPGSTFGVRDDLTTERSPNGNLEHYGSYSEFKKAFTLRHVLTAAQAVTLRDFYADNRLAVCELTWGGDGVTYDARFAAAPREDFVDGFWIFGVEMLEV